MSETTHDRRFDKTEGLIGSRHFPIVPSSFLPLVTILDGLQEPMPIDGLVERLEALHVPADDLQPYLYFDPVRYTRNLIAEGPHYCLLLLCWGSGQRSTIHDHSNSACAFKVLTGVCSETLYRMTPCGQVVPQCTKEFRTGGVVAAARTTIHQVSNLQSPGERLVTLHLYSPPLKGVRTFSIMGANIATDHVGQTDRWLPDENQVNCRVLQPCLDDEQFEKVVSFMRSRMRHDIHLADFAQQTGHSTAHFSVLFKNRTGCAPFHYLKELRLREAYRLIVAGDKDTRRIGEAVGYTNRDHFLEAFRLYWGFSARELIARIRRTAVN